MIAIPLSEFFTDWIALIHSFWFSIERFSNFLKQNNGCCKICLQDWLICAQIFKSSTSKFQKTFSARCWSPELLMIFSILDAKFGTSFEGSDRFQSYFWTDLMLCKMGHLTIMQVNLAYWTIHKGRHLQSIGWWQQPKL